ncbi:MAG: hypothetical protein Q8M11_02695 [Sulfuritalea sp.]|nr:hypothetical protein [Sulfuritalea sp.]MDP1984270.1 hypothetical protein [Sulfuritalea sp.]
MNGLRLLFDENLSLRLVKLLAEAFPGNHMKRQLPPRHGEGWGGGGANWS